MSTWVCPMNAKNVSRKRKDLLETSFVFVFIQKDMSRFVFGEIFE